MILRRAIALFLALALATPTGASAGALSSAKSPALFERTIVSLDALEPEALQSPLHEIVATHLNAVLRRREAARPFAMLDDSPWGTIFFWSRLAPEHLPDFLHNMAFAPFLREHPLVEAHIRTGHIQALQDLLALTIAPDVETWSLFLNPAVERLFTLRSMVGEIIAEQHSVDEKHLKILIKRVLSTIAWAALKRHRYAFFKNEEGPLPLTSIQAAALAAEFMAWLEPLNEFLFHYAILPVMDEEEMREDLETVGLGLIFKHREYNAGVHFDMGPNVEKPYAVAQAIVDEAGHISLLAGRGNIFFQPKSFDLIHKNRVYVEARNGFFSPRQIAEAMRDFLEKDGGYRVNQYVQRLFGRAVSWKDMLLVGYCLALGDYQYIFQIIFLSPTHTPRSFILAPAAQEKTNERTWQEHANLVYLHRTTPVAHIPEPFTAGDGYFVREGKRVAVTMRASEMLEGYQELHILPNVNGERFVRVNETGENDYLTDAESADVWRQIGQIMGEYALTPNHAVLSHVSVHRGDFVGRRAPDGRVTVKLIAVRDLTPVDSQQTAVTSHFVVLMLLATLAHVSLDYVLPLPRATFLFSRLEGFYLGLRLKMSRERALRTLLGLVSALPRKLLEWGRQDVPDVSPWVEHVQKRALRRAANIFIHLKNHPAWLDAIGDPSVDRQGFLRPYYPLTRAA